MAHPISRRSRQASAADDFTLPTHPLPWHALDVAAASEATIPFRTAAAIASLLLAAGAA
jgi:hypothetical protein